MAQRPQIAVTGADGQLGKELQDLADRFHDFDFIFLSKLDLPVEDPGAIDTFFAKYKPRWLINCAAFTAVDKAEEEHELAFSVNATAVGYLSTACKIHKTKLVHISTDYVFNGKAIEPYHEDSATDPVSVYGKSKLAGEQLALKNNPATIIIRSSWIYSVYGKNFVKTMLRLMKEKEQVNVVNDQWGSPTYAADLGEAILQIINSGKWVPGIFHYSNEGIITWYEFAVAVRDLTGSLCKINSIPASSYPTPAKRPAYAPLNKKKIQEVYGIIIKDWRQSLEKMIGWLNHGI
jgi:dTDP-4-dehydrorhamnose reductase